MGDGHSSKVRGGAGESRTTPSSALDTPAPRELSSYDVTDPADVAELQQSEQGCRYLVAHCSAELLSEPSENQCRGLLGVIRACRDSMGWLLKQADIEAKQALAAQIAAERAERAKRESGVSRASADVALSAFPSARGN